MKKILSLVGAAFGLGLMLVGAGCTNQLEGTWVSDQPVDGTVVQLEFTKSRIIGTGDHTNGDAPDKTSNFKIIVDYAITNSVRNVHQVKISNPEVNITGNLADNKTQAAWQEQGKAYLNQFNSFSLSVAEDGKTMTLNGQRTGEVKFSRK